MRLGWLALSLSSAFPIGTVAHPHSYVDQQVLFSLGLDVLEVAIVIVPSKDDGAAIYTHLDHDGDGIVSKIEASAFEAALLAETTLRVDDRKVQLGDAVTTVPSAEAIVAGTGRITVRASASFTPLRSGEHRVAFKIDYDAFSKDWFVQPFYFPDLIAAQPPPVVDRSDDGGGVTIRLGHRTG